MPPDPLLFLLLLPFLLLLSTALFHLLPKRTAPPRTPWQHALPRLRQFRLGSRRNLPRAAFGLPPHPRTLSVRATAFLAFSGAAIVSLSCGAAYLAIATASPSSGPAPLGSARAYNSRCRVALLAASILYLPATVTTTGAVALFLRHSATSSAPEHASTDTPDSTLSNSTAVPPPKHRPRLIHLVTGRTASRHLTHAAVLRATLAAALLTAVGTAACAAAPHAAGAILLGGGGSLVVASVGMGVGAWRGRRRALGRPVEAAAKYAAAMSFARKSRDALRSRSDVDTSGSTFHSNEATANTTAQSGMYVSSSNGFDSADLEYEHVLPHLPPPSSLGCSAMLACSEVYSTPLAARTEVERARAELAAAAFGSGSGSELQRTPPRDRASWCPPVGSPSSWVTEREAERASIPEWDFRHSLTQLGHRRVSSNMTAAGPAGETEHSEARRSISDSFYTAPSQPNAADNSTGDRRHRATPSASSSVRTKRHSSAPEPGSAHSQRPDGSFVAVYEATPFDPLPPHNFSSLASLPRSIFGSWSEAGVADMRPSVGAAIDGSGTLAVVDHGHVLGVHSYSTASVSNIANSSFNVSNSSSYLGDSDTSHGPRGRRPASLYMRSVDRLPTIPDTSPSHATFGSGSDLLADAEWVPVEPPAGAETWRRADGVCGLMAVVVLVLCFALATPLLTLGPHAATLAVYGASLVLPAPALALASYLTQHRTVMHSTVPIDAHTSAQDPHTSYSNHDAPSIDFGRIDYSQPRWSALGHGVSAVARSPPRTFKQWSGSLNRRFTPVVLQRAPPPPPTAPGVVRPAPAATAESRAGQWTDWITAGHARPATRTGRVLEMLKPRPQLCTIPAGPLSRLRTTPKTAKSPAAHVQAKSPRQEESTDGDEPRFISLDLDASPEAAQIRTGTAVRLQSRSASFIDLGCSPRSSMAAGGRFLFSDSMQAVVVGRLTRRRTEDGEKSYRVDSYYDAEGGEADLASAHHGVILRSLRPALDLPSTSASHSHSYPADAEDEGTPRISSSSFAPVRASTPLAKKPKGSTTTAASTSEELDLSIDWETLGLPPPPALPEEYCGLAYGSGSVPAYGPRSVSHAPSARLDDGEMARVSSEADASIVRNAGWIQQLVDGWRTPRSRRSAASARSVHSVATARMTRANSTRRTPQSGMSSYTATDARSYATPRAPSTPSRHSTAGDGDGEQTPSFIARMPALPPRAARPLDIPPLPGLPPPPSPLSAALTQPAMSPIHTRSSVRWSPPQSLAVPRCVAQPQPPHQTPTDGAFLAQATPHHTTRPTPHHTPHATPDRQRVPATPERAQVHRPTSSTSTYTVHHAPPPAEVTKAVGAVATLERVESGTRLRALKLVERAARRNSLKDVVANASVAPAPAARRGSGEAWGSTRSDWTAGTSRFADADEDLDEGAGDVDESRHTATFGRHLLRNARDTRDTRHRGIRADASGVGAAHIRPGRDALPNSHLTQSHETPPAAADGQTPPHAHAPARVTYSTYSPVRAAPTAAAQASAVTSTRDFSLGSSPSRTETIAAANAGEERRVGRAIRRPAKSSTAANVIFADESSTGHWSSTDSAGAKLSSGSGAGAGAGARAVGSIFHHSKSLSQSHSTSHGHASVSLGKLSSSSSALADCTNKTRSSGPPSTRPSLDMPGRPSFSAVLAASASTSASGKLHGLGLDLGPAPGPAPKRSNPPKGDKENNPASTVRTGRGRRARASAGPTVRVL